MNSTIYTNDPNQKPVSDMTKGELRAYRRELARAALTGYCAASEGSSFQVSIVYGAVDAMIEHERREEREGGDNAEG